MSKLMVVYWSQTGNTEIMANAVAEGVKEAGKESAAVEVSSMTPDALKDAPVFALGCPAMGAEVLEEDEMERGLKIMIDQSAGRVPVYFGIGAISTKKCCRLAKMAADNGAAGISVLQPMFLKPTEDELYLHFKTIAECVPETPVLLYNNPGRVNYTMSGKLVERLAHEVPNIVGMKDTSGDITQTAEFIRRTRDVGFKVFGGKDTLLYASMCHGAVGGVCTAANFMPELIVDVYNKYVAGDLKRSLEAQFKLNPVRLSMDGASFPVAAKDMANLRGRSVGLPYRPNLATPEGPVLDRIKSEMKQAGLI